MADMHPDKPFFNDIKTKLNRQSRVDGRISRYSCKRTHGISKWQQNLWGKIISLLGLYRFKRNEEIVYGKIFEHNRGFLPSGRTH